MQERVEDVSVLKRRLPPLLLLLLSEHPRGIGSHEYDEVVAVVSDQPTCPAAASHVAASSIHPYPLSAHVPEVTMGYMVVCNPAIILQAFLAASQKSPVVAASQSVVPHAQLAGLATAPFVVAQATKELHELNEDVQKSPVVDVQALKAPQTQGPELAVAPSPWAQAGAANAHRQALEL